MWQVIVIDYFCAVIAPCLDCSDCKVGSVRESLQAKGSHRNPSIKCKYNDIVLAKS